MTDECLRSQHGWHPDRHPRGRRWLRAMLAVSVFPNSVTAIRHGTCWNSL